MPLSNHDCSISPVIQVFIRFICGGSPSDSYESEVKLRLFGSIYKRFSCVIQAFIRFICGENMVRKWRNGYVFSAYIGLISCILVSKVAK